MPIEIPKEQLELILPLVARLRGALDGLTADLPFDAESALTFDPVIEASK